MRLGSLIDEIGSPISNIPWVDRYAGLVQTMHKKTSDGKEDKTYPVACNVLNGKCDAEVYDDLIPDDNVKSIVYWEELSNMTISKHKKNGHIFHNYIESKGKARIVVWANLHALGISSCKLPDECLLELQRELTISKKSIQIGNSNSEGELSVSPLRIVAKDIGQVFGKYTYNKQKKYYLKPYDFFALEVEFIFAYCLNNRVGFIPKTPINC